MNARWTISLAAFAAVLLGGALRATATQPTFAQNQPVMQGPAGIIRISTLMGTTVLAPQGQELGRIKDVLCEAETGQATFVILDAKIPGSGHAMLVVPYQALWVSVNPLDHRQSVVLDLRPDQLPAAPQIRNDQWDVLQNPQFLDQARNFYNVVTYTAARPIDNPSAPGLPAPCPVPQPCVGTAGPFSGMSQDLIDFYSE